jgi:PASTA domain/Tectonin domain
MMRKQQLTASILGYALSAVLVAAAQPARADTTPSFISYLGYVKDGYDFFNKYILGQPDVIAKMQAMINQAKTQIIAELDGLAAAWDSSCAANALDTFQNIDTLTPDNLQAFAISSDKCVTDAQALIGAVSTQAAIDKIGFALNTVGPIALIANARANFPTNELQQHIMSANQQLKAKLAPICDVSIDDPNSLPSFEGAVTGHGACYNFHVPTPTRLEVGERGGVFYLPPGPNTAFLAWPLLGDAFPDDDILWWRGHTVGFPAVDFSIAISEVMQGTSWQVADTVLNVMEPSVAPVGSPIALVVSTDTIYKPMDAFRVDSADNVSRGVLNPYPDGTSPIFSGWYPMDGALRSVATAANADGRVEMFGISRIGAIFHRWQQIPGDDGSWSPWAQMDGQLNSIAVARNQDGTLQVVGTNPAGNVWTRNQILGGDQFKTVQPDHPAPAVDSWTSWKQMDGVLSQVAAVTANGRIQLFGINGAGELFHRRQSASNATDPSIGGSWTAWDQVQNPGALISIAAAVDFPGRVNIFGITAGGLVAASPRLAPAGGAIGGPLNGDQIFQRVQLDGETLYTAWSRIPGSIHNLAAAKEGGGSGELVLIGVEKGNIYLNTSYGITQSTQNGLMPDSWKGWGLLPSTLGGNLAVMSPGNQNTILGASASVALGVSGGTVPYTCIVSGLPPGLSVSGSTIVGAPATAGSFAVTTIARDSTGEESGPVSFTWTVIGITVPNVRGAKLTQASSTLRSAGLGTPSQHNVVDANCNEPVGTVIGQSPGAGTQVAAGFVVQLDIETWPSGRTVCN